MPPESRRFELDHFFLGAPEPDAAQAALEAAGFAFGRPRPHPGQGTQGRFVFFDNAYLELLTERADPDVATELVRPLALTERTRWRETGACPFGICLRPLPGAESRIETWPYAAKYLPPGASMPIVTPRDSSREPMVFLNSQGKPPPEWPPQPGILLDHARGRHRVTGLSLDLPPDSALSPAVAEALASAGIVVRAGSAWRLEAVLDGGSPGKAIALDPLLPFSITP